MKILPWLFGYTETPNCDVLGIVRVTADEIDAEASERYEKKLRDAKAYIKSHGLSVRPLYNAKAQQ